MSARSFWRARARTRAPEHTDARTHAITHTHTHNTHTTAHARTHARTHAHTSLLALTCAHLWGWGRLPDRGGLDAPAGCAAPVAPYSPAGVFGFSSFPGRVLPGRQLPGKWESVERARGGAGQAAGASSEWVKMCRKCAENTREKCVFFGYAQAQSELLELDLIECLGTRTSAGPVRADQVRVHTHAARKRMRTRVRARTHTHTKDGPRHVGSPLPRAPRRRAGPGLLLLRAI